MAAKSIEGEPGGRNRRCFLKHHNDMIGLLICQLEQAGCALCTLAGPLRGPFCRFLCSFRLS
jgi:hypothetical protein